MILKNIAVNPYQVKDYFCITLSSQGPANGFPFLSVDRDSYIIGLEAGLAKIFREDGTALPLENAVQWQRGSPS